MRVGCCCAAVCVFKLKGGVQWRVVRNRLAAVASSPYVVQCGSRCDGYLQIVHTVFADACNCHSWPWKTHRFRVPIKATPAHHHTTNPALHLERLQCHCSGRGAPLRFSLTSRDRALHRSDSCIKTVKMANRHALLRLAQASASINAVPAICRAAALPIMATRCARCCATPPTTPTYIRRACMHHDTQPAFQQQHSMAWGAALLGFAAAAVGNAAVVQVRHDLATTTTPDHTLRVQAEEDDPYAPPTTLQGMPSSVLLYQYDVCPFCCKVKAFLDYNNVRRTIIITYTPPLSSAAHTHTHTNVPHHQQ